MARAAERLRLSQDGSVAVIFGLAVIPLVIATGAGIDYGRAIGLQAKLQTATDSTSLSLCKADPNLTTAQLTTKAQQSIASYLPGTTPTVDQPTVTNNPRNVTLTAHVSYSTAIMSLVGFATIPLTSTATCSAQGQPFEIALVLDNTGSMSESGGSGTKMAALKTAATNFVDYVYTNAAMSSTSKIAIVPFASSVAVDPTTFRTASWIDTAGNSTFHWNNVDKAGATTAGFKNRLDIFTSLRKVNTSWDWAGCFETLPYPLNVQDTKPSSSNANSYYVPLFAPDEAGAGGAIQSTRSQYNLNSYIDDATTDSNCKSNPSSDQLAESRACKYVKPANGTSASLGLLGPNGPNFGCTTQPLLRLVNNQTQLKNLINAMQPAGQTNIHEGLLWGWRTISPNSVFADGAAYNAANKVVVLMTDGFNTWLPNGSNNVTYSLYSALGYYKNVDGSTPNGRLPAANANPMNATQSRNAMDALTLEACANARNAGVQIYTVAFSVSSDPIDPQGIDMLKTCAGGSTEHAFVANDSTSLIAAFDKIAKNIGKLRLSR